MKILYLIRGLPGSGKTTFAKSIWASGIIFETDQYFIDRDGNYNFNPNKLEEAHKWCNTQVKNAMDLNKIKNQYYPEIIVSNTFTTEKEMKPYFDLASEYGYKVVSLIIENRHNNKSIHNVPAKTMEKMQKRFEIKLQ